MKKHNGIRAVWLTLAVVLLNLLPVQAEDLEESSGEEVAAALEYKPTFVYPAAAKRARLTGSGIAVLDVDPVTGKVTAARMAKSTGHAILDEAAIDAFRQARFRKGTGPRVKIPITYTLRGVPYYGYKKKLKNMDDVLARFLGKGTVVKGPIPEYPRFRAWTEKRGKGVYEMRANKTGKVENVVILKSSGDETFDRAAVKTLRKWRLNRGPLTLELPLSFVLTPSSFTVDVAR